LVIERYSPESPPGDIVELRNRCYADSPGFSPLTLKQFEELRAQAGFRPELLLTAYLSGKPVGLCLAILRQGDTTGWLEWIGVLPSYRRRRVAKALLERCVDSLRVAGAGELSVHSVGLGDLNAKSFLESQGFKVAYHQLLMVRNVATPLPDSPLPSSYRVRTLRPGEEEAWLRVRNESFREEPIARHAWSLEDFRREFAESPYSERGRIFVAEHSSEVVGVVAAWVFPYHNVEREMVHWLGVLPQHRRRGLGQALVVEALRFFKASGAKQARLITQSALPKAVRLYRKLGFEVEEERAVYSKPIA